MDFLTAAPPASPVISNRTDEHRYFVAAAVVLTFLVLWAFGFEYRDLIHPSHFTVLVQLHGLVMFAWVGLFLTQVTLIACRRPLWHRRLGIIGTAVAVLVVGLGVPTSITAARLGGDHLPAGLSPSQFLAAALSSFAAFALLVGGGLALRRRPDFHKRLMLLSNMPPLAAVFARLIFFLHLTVSIATLRNLLLLALFAGDTLRTRRLHPALAAGSALLIAADAGASALTGTAVWAGIVRTLTA